VSTATASFVVERFEQDEPYLLDAGCAYGRAHLSKTFTGELEGESSVEMLSVRGDGGSAGYVALERITGRLDQRRGSFALLHSATASAERQWGDWRIVPGSGTGDLARISGSARIEVGADGSHRLLLDYELG
jgi:hypothetical protein